MSLEAILNQAKLLGEAREQITTLRAQLKEKHEGWTEELKAALYEHEKAQKRNAKLREALEFYADKSNWTDGAGKLMGLTTMERDDKGAKARAALEESDD